MGYAIELDLGDFKVHCYIKFMTKLSDTANQRILAADLTKLSDTLFFRASTNISSIPKNIT